MISSGISVVYLWKSVVKFGGITSGTSLLLPVVFSEISVVY